MTTLKAILPSLCLLALASCQATKQEESLVFNLVDSTTIIRTLIAENNIATILEEADPEQVMVLLNNFSPAEIAFETEVLSCTLPTLLYFFDKDAKDHAQTMRILEELALDFENSVKFVTIDAQALFVIVDKSDVTTVPSFLYVEDRKEITRIEGAITKQSLKRALEKLIKHP